MMGEMRVMGMVEMMEMMGVMTFLLLNLFC